MHLGAAIIWYVGAAIWILNGLDTGGQVDFIVGGVSIIAGLYYTVKIFTGDKEKSSENVS